MFKQIFTRNTVAFTAIPTIDNVEQPLVGTSLKFMVKNDRYDSDEDALITQDSTTGEFTLSAEQTDIAEGRYWWEIRWYAFGAVYTIGMGMVNFIKTVIDQIEE